MEGGEGGGSKQNGGHATEYAQQDPPSSLLFWASFGDLFHRDCSNCSTISMMSLPAKFSRDEKEKSSTCMQARLPNETGTKKNIVN